MVFIPYDTIFHTVGHFPLAWSFYNLFDERALYYDRKLYLAIKSLQDGNFCIRSLTKAAVPLQEPEWKNTTSELARYNRCLATSTRPSPTTYLEHLQANYPTHFLNFQIPKPTCSKLLLMCNCVLSTLLFAFIVCFYCNFCYFYCIAFRIF